MTRQRLSSLRLAIAGALLALACWKPGYPDDRGAERALRAALTGRDTVLDFAKVAPFPWTKVHFFGPYTDTTTANRALGFRWPYRWSGVKSLDDRIFIVFVDSNEVVAAFEQKRAPFNVDELDRVGSMRRDSARLFITRNDSGGGHLQAARAEFEIELWPGEGIPQIELARDLLILFTSPSPWAPLAGQLALKKGTRIRYDSTRYQTIVPGRVDLLADTTITGRSLGSRRLLRRAEYYGPLPDTAIAVKGYRTIELLQYRAEGNCFLRIRQTAIETECPTERHAHTLNRETTLWWAFTRTNGVAGWFVVSDTTARVTGRRF
jgi:hypothetical protein